MVNGERRDCHRASPFAMTGGVGVMSDERGWDT